jgi:membrane AbrB-like protein
MTVVYSIAAAFAGAWLCERLHVPAGALIGAMVGIGGLKVASVPTWDIPASGRFVTFALVGWLLGQAVTRETLQALRGAFLPVLVVVGLFLGLGVALSVGLVRLGLLDPVTAILATAPGGIAQIGVLSVASGAQVPVVLAVHLLRVTSVVLLAPLIVRLLPGDGAG